MRLVGVRERTIPPNCEKYPVAFPPSLSNGSNFCFIRKRMESPRPDNAGGDGGYGDGGHSDKKSRLKTPLHFYFTTPACSYVRYSSLEDVRPQELGFVQLEFTPTVISKIRYASFYLFTESIHPVVDDTSINLLQRIAKCVPKIDIQIVLLSIQVPFNKTFGISRIEILVSHNFAIFHWRRGVGYSKVKEDWEWVRYNATGRAIWNDNASSRQVLQPNE
ncbi:hypothetical protein M0802_006328 [Mischocyttarus mexicanus]|nr:hypothetical protein M0802_006328 [Mischocyttarus mexicanus]